MTSEEKKAVICPRCVHEVLDTFGERLAAAMDVKAIRDAVHVALTFVVEDWPGLTSADHADYAEMLRLLTLMRERWTSVN